VRFEFGIRNVFAYGMDHKSHFALRVRFAHQQFILEDRDGFATFAGGMIAVWVGCLVQSESWF
jgi:hypothetical protein